MALTRYFVKAPAYTAYDAVLTYDVLKKSWASPKASFYDVTKAFKSVGSGDISPESAKTTYEIHERLTNTRSRLIAITYSQEEADWLVGLLQNATKPHQVLQRHAYTDDKDGKPLPYYMP